MRELSFLTYNMLQKPIGVNAVSNEFKNERLELFCELYINKFDIIAFQECFDSLNTRPYNLLKNAHRRGFKYFCKNPEPLLFKKPFIDGGLLILSKYPICESEHIYYSESVTIDRVMAKGVLWAKIKIPKSKYFVHVFNTHMQAYFSACSDQKQTECHIRRVEQLIILKKFVIEILTKNFTKGDLVIIAGDLNINSLNQKFNYQEVVSALNLKPEDLKSFSTPNEFDFYKTILEFQNRLFKVVHAFYKDQGHYPVTSGKCTKDTKGQLIPFETVISDKASRMDNSSIDYILEIKIDSVPRIDWRDDIKIKQGSFRIEEFLVNHPRITQLSDHFGLSFKIVF
jgi:endonuclease/exonuclease/phosphatase family metal-dependent hydrolase